MFAWNRIELLETTSFDYYMLVRVKLQEQGIKVQSRQVPLDGEFDNNTQTLLNRPLAVYYIYIHQDDEARAREIIDALGPDDILPVEAYTW